MIFEVAPEVFERWPTYIISCVFADGVSTAADIPMIDDELTAAESQVRSRLAGRDLKNELGIAVWRQAFSASGWTPSKYLSSVEALARRVAKGDRLPRINPIVDLANAAALRHLVPIGAHDPDQLAGEPLRVRLARPEDRFMPMGDGPDETPDPGEIVYSAGSVVRTRRWVWRQARTALVTAETRSVFFPVDGFRGETDAAVEEAAAYLAWIAGQALAARVTTGLVCGDNPRFATS